MFETNRPLGTTGLVTSVLGLGVEHLRKQPKETVRTITETAIHGGVNYIDLVWSIPELVEGVAQAMETTDKRIITAIHLGSAHRDGAYHRTRKPEECREAYLEVYERLPENHVPIINLHYLSQEKDWVQHTRPGRLMDTAIQLRDQGYGNHIAVSTHDPKVVKQAALHPEIGSIMYQVNISNHNEPERNHALHACKENHKGLVAMKPYAGGRLLAPGKKTKIAGYQRGGKPVELTVPETLTPLKLLRYALDQPAVSCVVSGPSTVEEVRNSLQILETRDIDYQKELEEISRRR